jgi:phosphoglycolate phosphatase
MAKKRLKSRHRAQGGNAKAKLPAIVGTKPIIITRHHKSSRKIKLFITDADGTLWSFWDYFVPAMQFVIPQLAQEMSSCLGYEISKDDFSREVGTVMYTHHTHEYPWVLEETPYRRQFKGSSQEFTEKFVVPFWAALDKFRLKYLRPYPEVRETLETLKEEKIPVVILSDAPFYMGLSRATQTDVSHLISGLYALDTVEPDVSSLVDPADIVYGRDRVRSLSNTDSRFERAVPLPKQFEKANTGGLLRICQDFGVSPDECVLSGDSLVKDGGVAAAAGVPYIWARYGTFLPAEYKVMIDKHLAPAPDSPINSSGHGVTFMPSVRPPMIAEAASFAEVLKHLVRKPYHNKGGRLNSSAQRDLYQGPDH